MAKSASDTKVEDVLSSVRRLVSGELPRNERPVLPEGPGALMLTNAQRIESSTAKRMAGRNLEQRIAELERAVGNTANDDDFEPDGSEDQAMHRPDRIVYTRPPLAEEADQMRRNTLRLTQFALIDTGSESEEADEASDVQLQFRRETSRVEEFDEAPMAEDVKETLTAAEVHVFTSPDDEIARIEARLNGEPEPVVPPREESPVVVLPEVAIASEVLGAEVLDAEEDIFATAPQVIEVPKIVEMDLEVDPQDNPADVLELDGQATDETFDADLEAAVSSVNEQEPQASQNIAIDHASDSAERAIAEDAIAEAAIDESVIEILDEEALRPMVAKLIREELQGELGERITRNVRKLVRREILRALAARDAE